MTISDSLEVMFSHSFQKFLNEKIEDLEHVITSSVLPSEDYAVSIGALRASKDVRDTFNKLLKEYFAR